MPRAELSLPHPLSEVVRGCATKCTVGCCNVDAFDVKASAMQWWVREAPDRADLPREQLARLIDNIASVTTPVWIKDYDHEWADGAACAQYLRKWLDEYSLALSLEAGRRT